jgi:hypothetical protein
MTKSMNIGEFVERFGQEHPDTDLSNTLLFSGHNVGYAFIHFPREHGEYTVYVYDVGKVPQSGRELLETNDFGLALDAAKAYIEEGL